MTNPSIPHGPFTGKDLYQIHKASMKILEVQGIIIKSESVLHIFRQHNFEVRGTKVFINEKQVFKAIETVPGKFKIRAWNPEKNLVLGNGIPVLCGTGGGVYIVQKDKTQRPGTLEDYKKIAMLVQTSPLNQMTAHESVHPNELIAETSHLDMMWYDLSFCDLAATSNTQDVHCLQDCLEILSIVFGGKEEFKKAPATLGIINPLSPLQYAPDQAEALVLLAQYGQPAAITNMLLLGSSAPISIPGALALGNAELLCGIVLSQIVNPGTPVIYGSTSSPLYMKNGASCLGAPETLILSKGVSQLSKYYGLPCRTGGALSDSHIPDGQAMAESSLSLNNAIESKVDYILHSFGMVSSFLGVSLEKWLMDEEICRYILASKQKIEVNEKTLEMDTILSLGSKGDYLTHPTTFKNFKSLFQHGIGNRDAYAVWAKKGSQDLMDQAGDLVGKRLARYQKPEMDQGMAQELKEWILWKKQEILKGK